jgi:hypothetical protein
MSLDSAPSLAATRYQGPSSTLAVEDSANPLTVRVGLFLVILGALVFFGSWWNRYVPPTSGGEAVLMAPWASDYLPYRDYFMQAPPGVSILVQAIKAIAGPHLIATLTFGALLRIAGACALYGLLLGLARPSYAAVATLTALFVSSTDISDTPFYYNHIGAALVLVGTYLGLAGAKGTRLRHHFAVVAGGVLLTYAIAVKQTMIFGAAAAFVALVVLIAPRPRAGWVAWLLGLLTGAAVTVGGIWAWLAAHDLVSSFFFVMQRAPEGKGGIGRSLFRPLSLLFDVREAFNASVAAWIVIALVATVWTLHRRGIHFRRDVVFLLVLLVTLWSIRSSYWSGRFATLFLTAVGWWGSLALAALHLRSLRKGSLDPVGRAHVAFGVLSFGIGYCFAVSWPLFENIAFPGLAVVVAAMLERPPSAFRRRWVRVLLVLAFASMGLAGYRKFTSPHSWGLWFEPPLYESRGRFEHPAFAGMRISEVSSVLYALVSQIAHERTRPDDRIFVFPNMPILYAIADRRPATYSLAHWVDICPDFLGKEDAARLRANPPKLMIIRDDSMGFVENEERLYRGGQRSSVRDIVKAFNDLAPLYDRVGVFRSTSAAPIFFLVRRNAAELMKAPRPR